jgi:hypothetical protein
MTIKVKLGKESIKKVWVEYHRTLFTSVGIVALVIDLIIIQMLIACCQQSIQFGAVTYHNH